MYKVLNRTCFAIVLLTRSYVALRPRFRRRRGIFIRDHKIRRRRGRELGGMGRGRRRKARKITLRILMEGAVCSITGFWFISENIEISNLVIDTFYQEHNHIITQWNSTPLNPPLLENYARAINLKEVHYSIALVL